MKQPDVVMLSARRAGLSVDQDEGIILMALAATLEKVGAKTDIPFAQKTLERVIAAGNNEVIAPEGFFRIVSSTYIYGSGDSAIEVPLGEVKAAQFDFDNRGTLHSQAGDQPRQYLATGDKILIGPGVLSSGGIIRLRLQRPLTFADIEHIPNGLMLVSGTVANLLDAKSPEARAAMAEFLTDLSPMPVEVQETRQEYSEISLGRDWLGLDAARDSLII